VMTNTTATPATFTVGTIASGTPITPQAPGTDSTDIQVSVSSGGSVRMDEIEDIVLNLGSGGDTVNVTTPLSGTALNVNTITVNGGTGNDTVDASGITSGHRVVFNGGDGNDTFTSGGGDDIFNGGEGDDTFYAGTGNDEFDGGTGNDRVVLSGDAGDFTITFNPNGTVSIENNGSGAVTTVKTNVEAIEFTGLGGPITINPVSVFDSGNVYRGSFATIQDAIDDGATVGGDVIVVASGTYNEDLTVNKAVTIQGANSGLAGNSAGRGGETTIDGTITVSTAVGSVVLDGIEVLNSSDNSTTFNGLVVTGAADMTVTNSVFTSVGANASNNFGDRAIYLTTGAQGDVVIANNAFGGASTDKYGTANWSSGIWSDGAALSLTITGNAMDHLRTAMNLDSFDNATSDVSGNEISNSGTGISVGVGSDATITTIDGNSFTGVDTDFNLRNMSSDIDFDLGGNIGADGIVVLGGSGNDTVTGSSSNDFFDGRGYSTPSGNDTFEGKGGDDIMFARDGNDTAVFTTALNASDFTATNGLAIGAGIFDGWVVNAAAGGEGTDTLIDVEIVETGAGRFLLVGNGGFDTIGAAIAEAVNGDTILLAAGTYSEDLTINKLVTIIGANGGVVGTDAARDLIAGAGESTIAGRIVVLYDGVTIDGVRVLNGNSGGAFENAGIHVQAENVTIENSVFYRDGVVDADVSRGITHSVGSGDGLTVSGNAFTGWHTGTYVNGGTNVTVENNLYEGNLVGMSLDAYAGATGLAVTGNTFTDQILEGMGIGSLGGASWAGDISGNTFNGAGVFNYDPALATDLVEGNTFNGTAGNDTLSDDSTASGRIGGNTLVGGDGDDVYLVSGNDTVVEAAGEGTDEVRTTDSYILPDHVEKLTLLDGASSFEDFEGFDLGPIANGENGWAVAGGPGRDQSIVDDGGNQVFRMSSDPSITDFAGPYSAALPATAGEPGTSAGFNGHTIKFRFKPVDPTGDNSRLEVDFGRANATDRNNFMVLEATAAGIRIAVNEPLTDGNWANNSFTAFTGNVTLADGVSLGDWHDIELHLTYVDGPDNDVIEVYLDGAHIGTTTTFENYRDALGGLHEDNAEANQTSRIFFRPSAGGAPVDGPGGENEGFLFDDLQMSVHNSANGTGNDLANTLTGNSGNNTLLGLGGDDFLFGLDGNDILNGGLGEDILTGGLGGDTFVFDADALLDAVNNGIQDLIADYDILEGDVVDLSALLGGQGVNDGNETSFVRVDGTGKFLEVDIDGVGTAHDFVQIAEFSSAPGAEALKILVDDSTDTTVTI
jgi:hypothetical protein